MNIKNVCLYHFFCRDQIIPPQKFMNKVGGVCGKETTDRTTKTPLGRNIYKLQYCHTTHTPLEEVWGSGIGSYTKLQKHNQRSTYTFFPSQCQQVFYMWEMNTLQQSHNVTCVVVVTSCMYIRLVCTNRITNERLRSGGRRQLYADTLLTPIKYRVSVKYET